MTLVLGFLGFFNAVLTAPILGGLLIANVESTPSDPNLYLITIGKGLIDNVLSDFLWARAIILTSPVVATLGLGQLFSQFRRQGVAAGAQDGEQQQGRKTDRVHRIPPRHAV